MPNIWKWRAVDAKGKPVEAAPGNPVFISRGPTTKAGMVQAATILLNNKRNDAIREDMPDPGYKIDPDSIEPVGENPDDLPGDWQPSNAGPINLPTDPAVRAAQEKRLAEEVDGDRD